MGGKYDTCIWPDCSSRACDAVDGPLPVCSTHYWRLIAEVEEGFWRLREYLKKVSAFQAWCRDHGVAA